MKRFAAWLKTVPLAFWVGGGLILAMALLFWGLRILLPPDGGGQTPDLTATATGLVAEVLPSASHTLTPAPTDTPTPHTLALTHTPTSTHLPALTATVTATPSAPMRTPTATPMPTLDSEALPPPNAALGDTWERPGDGMVLVYVPEGSFLMGSAVYDADAYDWEKPQHRVTLDAFWLDQTEVTNGQYERCVADGDCRESSYADAADWNGRQQPVVGVSWDDAAAYCAWAGGQLPTEAQWEYAARGPESLKYPWGNDAPDETLLNYSLSVGGTTEVGSYPAGASWVGALDMAGNVYEWVADWYGSYDSAPVTNPAGPAAGEYKVLRGGSWGNSARNVRGAYRGDDSASDRYGNIGFRCLVPQG